MKTIRFCTLLLVVLLISGCASQATNTMQTTRFSGGTTEVITYSKFYNSASWVIEGEVGLEVWVDHDKTVGPFYSLQRSMGWLGPSDLEASGIVTGYVVNLDEAPRHLSDFRILYAGGGDGIAMEQDIELDARSVTQLLPGSIPISNYGTQVRVTAEFILDGDEYSIPLVANRLTGEELENLRGDFPWFQAPYYPFDPPLTNTNF